MRRLLLIIAFLIISLTIGIISCDEKPKENSISKSDNLKVYIDGNGTISIDDVVKTIEDLESAFKKLKETNGTVHYSRAQDYEGDVSIEVINLVTKYNLPLAFYTDDSFTEKVVF